MWIKKAEVDAGKQAGVTADMVARLKALLVKAWNGGTDGKGATERSIWTYRIPFAGDAPKAKATAIQSVESAGFYAPNSGSLRGPWRQQPGTPAYCTELAANELQSALQSADHSRTPGDRAPFSGSLWRPTVSLISVANHGRNPFRREI